MEEKQFEDLDDDELHQTSKTVYTNVDNDEFLQSTTGYVNNATKFQKRQDMLKICNLYNDKAKHLCQAGFPLFVGPSLSDTDLDPRDSKISAQLHDFLDELITPSTSQQDLLYYKLQWLIYNGKTQDEFVAWMQKNDYSLKCNCIWENDAAAYRCNTCALSPCMSLCSACFLRNGHAGHDFTRFFSREGGACDCGNPDVLKPEGFCDRHGDDVIKNRPESAYVRLPMLEYIFMKLFARLFMGLRCRVKVEADQMEDDDPDTAHIAENQMLPFKRIISFLQELLDVGGPIRECMVRVLMDTKLYTALTERTVEQTIPLVVDFALDWRFKRRIDEEKLTLCTPDLIEHFRIQDPAEFTKFNSLLDELLFWIMRMNFPQALINVSLKMLSENDYMRILALRFFLWYPLTVNSVKQICTVYEDKHVEKKFARNICNRIVHISVQMLSSKVLSIWLNEQVDLTNCLLKSAAFLLLEHTEKLQFTYDSRFKYIKDAGDQLIELATDGVFTWDIIDGENSPLVCQHGYWFIVGDLQNILAHCELARNALLHPEAKHTFVNILCHLQGMYGFWRIVSGDHRVDDRWQPSERAMLLEYELSGSTMCAFTTAIIEKKENSAEAAISYYDVVLAGLKRWLRAVAQLTEEQSFDKCGDVSSPVYHISFHIPLHRHLANAISNFNCFHEFSDHVEELRKDEHLLRLMLLFPLRIQAARTEQYANMWIRNGVEMRNPCALYPLPHFGVSMMIPDVNLIRFCAANVDESWFMRCIMDAYHLSEIFTLTKEQASAAVESMEVEDFVTRSSNMAKLMMDTEDDFDCDSRPMETQRKLDDLVKVVFGGTGSPEQPGRQGQLARLLVTADDALKIKLSSSLPSMDVDGYPKIKLEWSPETNAVLTRAEWVDHVVTGALRLIASLIVLRINCGNTEEEELTQELVADLASEPSQYSRLKSNRYERVTHSGTAYDELFDKVLSEIATYLEPDHNGKMQSGRYTLQNMTWIKHFCPIYCAFYSHSHRAMALSYQRVEQIEHQLLSPEQRKYVSHVWLPYRIPEFSYGLRHKSVHNIAKILLTDKFCQLALLIIVDSESTKLLNETPLQLVVYLLTMYAKYVSQMHFEDRQAAIDKLFKKYSIRTGDNYAVHSVFSSVYTMMLSECRKKGITDHILKCILNGHTDISSSRITGGMIEYTARFFAYLCPVSELSQIMLTLAMREVGMSHSPLSEMNGQTPPDATVTEEAQRLKEKKLAAQKRREAVMAAAQKKNLNAMKRVMEKEGLSASDVESITVENKDNLRRYDCPICGELNQPTTANKPFGLLTKWNRNALTLVAVPDGTTVESLEKIDTGNNSGERFTRGHRRRYLRNYEDLIMDGCGLYRGALLSSVTPKLNFAELKTCGHTAHIKCFDAYQKSIHEGEMPIHIVSQRYVYCPVCRYAVDMQVPVPLDVEVTDETAVLTDDDNGKVFDLLANSVLENFGVPRGNSQPLKIGTLNQLRSRINEHRRENKAMHEQTYMCLVVKAQIERALMLCKLKIPDARGNSRLLPIEHLLSAAVAVSSLDDRDFALFTAWDLTKPTDDAILEDDATSSEAMDVVEVSNPEQPSTSRDRKAEDEMVEHLTDLLDSDELRIVTASSATDRELTTSLLPTKIETLEDRQKLLKIIQRERKHTVPLLSCDLSALLVRQLAFSHCGNRIKPHDKNRIYRMIVRRFLPAVATRASLWMLQRLSRENLRALAMADFSASKYQGKIIPTVLAAVAGSLARHESVFVNLLSQMESDFSHECISVEDVVETITKHLFEFSLFASELLRSLDFEQAYTLTDMDLVFQWLQTDSSCLLPPKDMLDYWISHFLPILGWNYKSKSKVLCHEPLVWQPFTLLELPQNYDDLFCRFFKRPCAICNSVPTYPLICLLCGQLICLDECCYLTEEKHISEIERHTRECVQHGAVYLSLTTSYIIVTKKKECGFWGTLYLDSHGEEDYNLRRGKPLELSLTRYNKLKTEWAEQEYPRVPVWWSPQITLENFKANSNRF